MVNIERISNEIRRAWRDSAPLTAVSVIFLACFLGALTGLAFGEGEITGVPAWLKPAKFALSTAIYSATLAWLYRYIRIWPRPMRAAAWITAAGLAIEIAIIFTQAARGTTSHFNTATPLDGALFGVMGSIILLVWLASAVIAAALLRQRFEDRGWGWSLRAGMLVTVIGSAAGGMMIRATPEQALAIEAGARVTTVGAHSVGAADGAAPTAPVIHWNSENGDLRVPHFFGLHGVNAIPLLSWLLLRGRRTAAGALAIAASYLALTGIVAWQALRGESLFHPDPATLAVLAVWLALSVLSIAAAAARPLRRSVAA
jgi:hypothetical protein